MYINTADVSLFWLEGFVFHFRVGCVVRIKLLLKIVLCTCVLFVGLSPLGVILEPVQLFTCLSFSLLQSKTTVDTQSTGWPTFICAHSRISEFLNQEWASVWNHWEVWEFNSTTLANFPVPWESHTWPGGAVSPIFGAESSHIESLFWQTTCEGSEFKERCQASPTPSHPAQTLSVSFNLAKSSKCLSTEEPKYLFLNLNSRKTYSS